MCKPNSLYMFNNQLTRNLLELYLDLKRKAARNTLVLYNQPWQKAAEVNCS